MKRPVKEILSLIVLFFFQINAYTQVNKGMRPLSDYLPADFLPPLEEISLPGSDIVEAMKKENSAKNGSLPLFAYSVAVNITPDNAGIWTELPGGDRVWRAMISSKNALGLLPYFDKFFLPPGAAMHVYSPGKEEVIGAFTSFNNPADGYFATGLIHGESCIIEYYEPADQREKGIISLNEVGHAFRWVKPYSGMTTSSRSDSLGFLDSGFCEVNANCSEGDNFQDQRRSAVCMVVKTTLGSGLCSAAMINNVREDCTPYLLSAQHCSEGTVSSQYSQYLFYFNYEAPGCSTPSTVGTLEDQFITGCTKIADSNDNGGNNGSDFLLLRLNHIPPDNFGVYLSGWNRINLAAALGVIIHFPQGDLKKISTYNQALISTSWGGVVSGTHWQVRWAQTLHGHGVTEIGSSGASLFNQQGQIVGTLTGGGSDCSVPDSADYCGKFSFDWTSNGTVASRQLQPWLDPDNTGVLSWNGRNAGCPAAIGETYKINITFNVMPNPSTGLFHLLFLDREEKEVRVLDELGRQLFTGKLTGESADIDLRHLSRGMYLLQVETKQGSALKKLVKTD